jgi:hypothetical protein
MEGQRMIKFLLPALSLARKLKPVHIGIIAGIALIGFISYQDHRITTLKHENINLTEELLQAEARALSNGSAVESLTQGSWQTVNQLQAANKSCTAELKGQKKTNSIINAKNRDHETAINLLRQKIRQINDSCTDLVIPPWLLE